MDIASQVKQSLKHAGEWLRGIRQEKGGWQDMVYKQQGILNTAEAWRGLWLIRSVDATVSWEPQWLVADVQRLASEVEQHGFVRSPYAPANQLHESVDAAAFVRLMLAEVSTLPGASLDEEPIRLLQESAIHWLIENQSPEGGWSWGTLKDGCPLYPYFTYMSLQALQTVTDETAHAAVVAGRNWLMESQNPDGSFPMHSLSSEPDIVATAYAAIALFGCETPDSCAALEASVRYLLSAPHHDLTQVGHLKIVEPDQPPQFGVSYENYSVAADVLLALVKARPHFQELPQLDDRIDFLVGYLLEQQADSGGWPKSYSTLYVTHTVIEALVAWLEVTAKGQHRVNAQAKEHFNPYVFGFPIQQPQLFFGRGEIIARIRADVRTPLGVKRDVALIGERRIGKTSLLYQLPSHLSPEGHRVFYLDLTVMQSIGQLLQTFVAELGRAVFGGGRKENPTSLFVRAIHRLDRKLFRKLNIELQLPFVKLTTAPTEEMFSAFLADVENLMETFRHSRKEPAMKVIGLLDDIASLSPLGQGALYGMLLGLAQKDADLVFIVAGTPQDFEQLAHEAKPFAEIFAPIPVGPLEREAAIELITRPVKSVGITYDSEALERLLTASETKPYLLQALCYHCLRQLPSSQNHVTERIAQQAIDEWQAQMDFK